MATTLAPHPAPAAAPPTRTAFDLRGLRVLVTGGSRGVGRAVVDGLREAGAVVLTCHRPGSGAAHPEPGPADPGAVAVVEADLRREADVEALVERSRRWTGGLDVVINNVGVHGAGSLDRIEPDAWTDLLDHNLTTTYRVTRHVLPILADGGAVINIGASAADRGRADASHYLASKAAVHGLTRAWSKEFGPRGIRVNTVAPGLVDTGELPPPLTAAVVRQTSLGRLATPRDVAAVVLLLCTPAAALLTGVTIPVDGGL